jgi:hypothetical protein
LDSRLRGAEAGRYIFGSATLLEGYKKSRGRTKKEITVMKARGLVERKTAQLFRKL